MRSLGNSPSALDVKDESHSLRGLDLVYGSQL